MYLAGRKTYAVCIVIVTLAAVQKFLAVTVPQEAWIALFGCAVASMRAAVADSAKGGRP